MRQLLLLIFVMSSILLSAQPAKRALNIPTFDEKPLHFGFYVGLNVMDYSITHKAPSKLEGAEKRYGEVVSLTPGINIGMVTSLKLNKRLNFRALPGISFGQRDILFVDSDGNKDDKSLEIKSTYLEMPLLIKYNGSRMVNAKPFLVGGINPRFDLAKTKKDGLYMNSFDTYLEIGAGIDSYMAYFRFTTELKLSVGLFNMLNPAGTGEPEDILYTHVLDKITSRIFQLTFYFE